MSRSTFGLILIAACLAGSAGASAQVYRWTDERGGVNYGSKPPANARNVVKVNEDDGRVSTMPSVPPEVIQSTRARSEQRRVDQLQSDLDAERRANRYANSGSSADYQAWLERCRAERRVDCDDPNRGGTFVPGYTAGVPVYPYPPVVRPPIQRPQPLPPVQQQPWPQGNAVVPSPRPTPGPRIAGPPGQAVPQ